MRKSVTLNEVRRPGTLLGVPSVPGLGALQGDPLSFDPEVSGPKGRMTPGCGLEVLTVLMVLTVLTIVF